jgi:hypothetical protein
MGRFRVIIESGNDVAMMVTLRASPKAVEPVRAAVRTATKLACGSKVGVFRSRMMSSDSALISSA